MGMLELVLLFLIVVMYTRRHYGDLGFLIFFFFYEHLQGKGWHSQGKTSGKCFFPGQGKVRDFGGGLRKFGKDLFKNSGKSQGV